jgi:DNA polymerase III epsilon subunit-like protein
MLVDQHFGFHISLLWALLTIPNCIYPRRDLDIRPVDSNEVTSVQFSFEVLIPQLSHVTFCVVHIETAGGSPTGEGITEIGAVKYKGGQEIGDDSMPLFTPDAVSLHSLLR